MQHKRYNKKHRTRKMRGGASTSSGAGMGAGSGNTVATITPYQVSSSTTSSTINDMRAGSENQNAANKALMGGAMYRKTKHYINRKTKKSAYKKSAYKKTKKSAYKKTKKSAHKRKTQKSAHKKTKKSAHKRKSNQRGGSWIDALYSYEPPPGMMGPVPQPSNYTDSNNLIVTAAKISVAGQANAQFDNNVCPS
jgi:hypothetical protein